MFFTKKLSIYRLSCDSGISLFFKMCQRKAALGFPAKSLMCRQWDPHPNSLNKKVKHSFVTLFWLYKKPAEEQVRPRFQCLYNIYHFARVSTYTFLKLVFVQEDFFLFSVLYLFKALVVCTTKWENNGCFTLISQRLWIWKETDCMRFARREREREMDDICETWVFFNDSLTCVSKFTCWLEWSKK